MLDLYCSVKIFLNTNRNPWLCGNREGLLTPTLTKRADPLSHYQHDYSQQKGRKMWPDFRRGAGAAQVKQTPLEAHLLGVLPQRLPDGADFPLAVGQRGEGTGVKSFPVAVTNRRSSDQQSLSFHSSRSMQAASSCHGLFYWPIIWHSRQLPWMRVRLGFNYHGNCIKKWNNIPTGWTSVLECKDGLFLLLNSGLRVCRNNDKRIISKIWRLQQQIHQLFRRTAQRLSSVSRFPRRDLSFPPAAFSTAHSVWSLIPVLKSLCVNKNQSHEHTISRRHLHTAATPFSLVTFSW